MMLSTPIDEIMAAKKWHRYTQNAQQDHFRSGLHQKYISSLWGGGGLEGPNNNEGQRILTFSPIQTISIVCYKTCEPRLKVKPSAIFDRFKCLEWVCKIRYICEGRLYVWLGLLSCATVFEILTRGKSLQFAAWEISSGGREKRPICLGGLVSPPLLQSLKARSILYEGQTRPGTSCKEGPSDKSLALFSSSASIHHKMSLLSSLFFWSLSRIMFLLSSEMSDTLWGDAFKRIYLHKASERKEKWMAVWDTWCPLINFVSLILFSLY